MAKSPRDMFYATMMRDRKDDRLCKALESEAIDRALRHSGCLEAKGFVNSLQMKTNADLRDAMMILVGQMVDELMAHDCCPASMIGKGEMLMRLEIRPWDGMAE